MYLSAIKYIYISEGEPLEWYENNIPSAVLKAPGFSLSVIGYQAENGIYKKRITTEEVFVPIYPSGELNGTLIPEEELKAGWLDMIEGTVTSANNNAAQATIKAEQANEKANQANTTANSASTTASEAKEIANSASATANEAKKIADLTKSAHDILSEKANDFANAIKGKKEGNLIVIDDISPVEHNVKVKANGKNLFNCLRAPIQQPKDNIAYISAVTENSITITSKETSTGNGYTHVGSIKIKDFLPQLEVGKTYVLSANSDANIKAIYIPGISFLWKFNEPLTSTNEVLNSGLAMYGYHPTYDGFGDCVISNIQIEEGKIATEYEPYIDPTAVTVTGCGKNLVPSVDTWANNTASTVYYPLSLKDNEFYTVSAKLPKGEIGYFYIQKSNNNFSTQENIILFFNNGGNIQNELPVTFQKEVGYDYRFYWYSTQYKISEVVSNLQLEVGTEATEYEAYKSDLYTPNTDGACDVKSISPYMQIFTDTEGIRIECEYNRDIEKVIDNAIKEVNGIKYVRDFVEAHQLEEGVYIVDELNDGCVYFENDKFAEVFDFHELYNGLIIVSYDNNYGAKQIVVFSRDNSFYIPKIFVTYITEEGTFIDDSTAAFMPKSYIDEQVKVTNDKIKEINGIKYITEGVDLTQLEDGIYIIDGDNGGQINILNDELFELMQTSDFFYGMLFVTTDNQMGAKEITVIAKDEAMWYPQIFTVFIDNEGNYLEGTKVFVDKTYVDEQAKVTNDKIKEINGIKCITEEVNANELNYGIYTIDDKNGVVYLPDREIYSGMIFVSNNVDCGKQILVLDGLDGYGVPKLEIFPMSSDSNEYNGSPDAYAPISYVDAISNSIPLETLYRFNYAELDSSILSKTIEPMTKHDVPTLKITFKLKVANVNADGTITPYFNLPLEYMNNPTLMMDSYIKNIADFKSFSLKSPLLSADFKSFEEMTTKLLNNGIAKSSDIRIVTDYDNGEISILTVWFLSFSSDAARDNANQETITPVMNSVTDFALKYEKHRVTTIKLKLLNH